MELTNIVEIIREAICDNNFSADVDDDLEEIGLSSFDLMVVISLIEDRYKVQVDITRLSDERTIKGLFDSVRYL